jgi:hypothetical protein
VYRPVPRRTFDINPTSADSSYPPSPAAEMSSPDGANLRSDLAPSRTKSILNLTSSTLFGIYSPMGTDGGREELSTPWGTGAQTPVHRASMDTSRPRAGSMSWDVSARDTRPKLPRKGFRGYILPLVLQTILLFGAGVGYGSLVTHLHKTQQITPLPVMDVERSPLYYQLSWGVLGVLLGNALPLVDALWRNTNSDNPNLVGVDRKAGEQSATIAEDSSSTLETGLGPIWLSAVRSIGVFVGIAFAMVRHPFTSPITRADHFSDGFHGSRRFKLHLH